MNHDVLQPIQQPVYKENQPPLATHAARIINPNYFSIEYLNHNFPLSQPKALPPKIHVQFLQYHLCLDKLVQDNNELLPLG